MKMTYPRNYTGYAMEIMHTAGVVQLEMFLENRLKLNVLTDQINGLHTVHSEMRDRGLK